MAKNEKREQDKPVETAVAESHERVAEIDDQLENEPVLADIVNPEEVLTVSPSIVTKQRQHDQLENDVEAFLAKGGKIKQLDSYVTAELAQRPVKQYGRDVM